MMLVDIALFASVLAGFACGANTLSLLIASCSSTNGGLQNPPHFECTTSVDWRDQGFKSEDCIAAIQRFHDVEVNKHRDTEFEFLSPGAIPYTSNPVMQTPRRYRAGQSASYFKETGVR